MALLKRVRVLAAKIEATSGTVEALTSAEGVFNAFDVEIQANIDYTQRKGQAAFSNLPGVLGSRAGTLTFKTYLYGDGAGGSPGWATVLLPACGFIETATVFSPSSETPGTNVKTVTIAVYENGVKKFLRGAAGTFKLMLTTGKPISIEWTFTGVWQAPIDATILAPTYPTRVPIRFVSSAFTIGGATPSCMESIEIDANNTVVMRDCPTAADLSGNAAAVITDRNTKGSMNPESRLVATEDVFGLWIAGTEEALSISVADAQDTIVIAAPKVQRVNVQEGERNGLQIDQIEFQCNKSAAAGNDELTITFNATI